MMGGFGRHSITHAIMTKVLRKECDAVAHGEPIGFIAGSIHPFGGRNSFDFPNEIYAHEGLIAKEDRGEFARLCEYISAGVISAIINESKHSHNRFVKDAAELIKEKNKLLLKKWKFEGSNYDDFLEKQLHPTLLRSRAIRKMPHLK